MHSLISLLSLIPRITNRIPFHIDSLSLCHQSSFLLIQFHYDSFPMTHSFFPFVYKTLALSMYSLSYSYSFVLEPSPIHLEPLLNHLSPQTIASVQYRLVLQQVDWKFLLVAPSPY